MTPSPYWMMLKSATIMTTSYYPQGFPDIAELEKLANQFFKSLPGGSADDAGIATLAHSGLTPQAVNVLGGVDSPDAYPPIPSPQSAGWGIVPPSASGFGMSLPATKITDGIDLRDPQSILPGSDSIGAGNVPT